MPNRMTKARRAQVYAELAQRYGDKCADCGIKPSEKHPLEIDHMDGNPNNYRMDNLRILCRSCNRKAYAATHPMTRKAAVGNNGYAPVVGVSTAPGRTPPVTPPLVSVSESEGDNRRRSAKQGIDVDRASAELQYSRLFEPAFRDYVVGRVMVEGWVSRKVLIKNGADLVDCSLITAERYLEKMDSDFGPLKRVEQSGLAGYTLKPADERRAKQ